MQKLPLILAGAVAFTLPMAAQVTRIKPDQNVHLQSAVWQQDRDDRQQGDRDRDRDHDRGNGENDHNNGGDAPEGELAPQAAAVNDRVGIKRHCRFPS